MITGRCPRCHGSLSRQYDEGWEDECIQCGYIRFLTDIPKSNNLNHRQYDVEIPYTSSPSICQCIAYPTIPRFSRLNRMNDYLPF